MNRLTYALEDQSLMERAQNYFAWQARVVLPAVGRRVVEVGCGSGNFTGALLGREMTIAVDIERACVERAAERYPRQANLHVEVCGPGDAVFDALIRYSPDSCVCLNVLEHIEDDAGALRAMAAILPAEGSIALLVPAFPALYGPIDRNLNHYRRYTRGSLTRIAAAAGLRVERVRYMNMAGFFGWWFNARVLRREAQSSAQIALFDRWVVPMMSRLEDALPPPFGQSLFAVLRKL